MDNAYMLGEISGKLDAFAKLLTAHVNDSKERSDDHEQRIRSLEAWRDKSVGKVAGVVLVGGFVAGLAFKFVPVLFSALFPR